MYGIDSRLCRLTAAASMGVPPAVPNVKSTKNFGEPAANWSTTPWNTPALPRLSTQMTVPLSIASRRYGARSTASPAFGPSQTALNSSALYPEPATAPVVDTWIRSKSASCSAVSGVSGTSQYGGSVRRGAAAQLKAAQYAPPDATPHGSGHPTWKWSAAAQRAAAAAS